MTRTSSQPVKVAGEKLSLVDQVIGEIRTFIKEENLAPGDMLPSETTFSEKLGVSRTIAREAFRALAAVGILDIGNGRRARVAIPDATALSLVLDHTVHIKQLSIQQIFDVRRTLEIRTASLAALRRSDTEAARLQQIVDSMIEVTDRPNELLELDIDFHALIAQTARNPLYSLLIGSFRATTTQQTFIIGWQSRERNNSHMSNIQIHRDIADAIAAQDPVAAEQAMSHHFDAAIQLFVHAGII